MPKTISILNKREWLEKFESGASEASLASRSRCDIRTVKRGLEEARHEREARVARTELLKNALIDHQERLTGTLRKISASIEVPAKDWAVLSWYQGEESIFEKNLQVDSAVGSSDKGQSGTDTREIIEQEMLREHLMRDRLWRVLAFREKVYNSHRTDRIMFQRKIITILEEATGYKLVEQNATPEPFLYSYTAGDLFFKMSLRWAFGDKNTDWLNEIIADNKTGNVSYHHSTLANSRGREEECRNKLLAAFKQMQSLSESIVIVGAYTELEEATLKSRRVIEEILALGIIPGQCKVCRRLGM